MTTSTKTGPLVFPKRARTIRSSAARGRHWDSECGRYRVRESHVRGYAVKFYAQFLTESVWDVLSEHQKRATAEAACQQHARERGDESHS